MLLSNAAIEWVKPDPTYCSTSSTSKENPSHPSLAALPVGRVQPIVELAGVKFVEFVKKAGRDDPSGASLRSYRNSVSVTKTHLYVSTYFLDRLQNAIESPPARSIQKHAQQKGLIHRTQPISKSNSRHDE